MLQAKQDLLVLEAQGGNQKAFNILYRLYNKSLLRFAFKISNNDEITVEAVQQAWIKLSKNLRRLHDPRVFKSWLYRCVRWRVLEGLRTLQKQRQRFEEFDEVIHQQNDSTQDQNEIGIIEIINSLPTTEKLMIHLFYLDEMRLVEISNVLEIPVGTVKSRLNRARKLLKEKFVNSGENDEY